MACWRADADGPAGTAFLEGPADAHSAQTLLGQYLCKGQHLHVHLPGRIAVGDMAIDRGTPCQLFGHLGTATHR